MSLLSPGLAYRSGPASSRGARARAFAAEGRDAGLPGPQGG